jgi:carbon-monoxide dehydrogenase large subunit
MHTPTPHTEYGMKGMGEGGAIPPPAVIANAVRDALMRSGAEVNQTPMTPQRVRAAIVAAQERNQVASPATPNNQAPAANAASEELAT